MTWKIKDLKEFCKGKHDEDVVEVGTYCRSIDSDRYEEWYKLRVRHPKRTDFLHRECRFCEPVTVKKAERLYCEYRDDVIGKYDEDSCSNFQHKDYDLEFTE